MQKIKATTRLNMEKLSLALLDGGYTISVDREINETEGWFIVNIH